MDGAKPITDIHALAKASGVGGRAAWAEVSLKKGMDRVAMKIVALVGASLDEKSKG